MGCKNGSENKEEEKNEIKVSVIDTIMEDNDDDNPRDPDKGRVRNLDYYLKKEQEELNSNKEDDRSYENYSKLIFDIINEIRDNPPKYAIDVEDAMENIIETGELEKKKIIFKKQIKVGLNRGEPAFRDAAKILREIDHLYPFTFKKELCVPIPLSQGDLMNPNYLRIQINNIRQNTKVDAYFKEMVKSPKISALLMMVDDNKENSGKKRMLLLSNELKNIGISSGFVNGNFVAYFAFSR